uniref:Ras family protein n=1 Tax=Angiostrongylus cantonensis TaxID=6313 RepID=A0A0K0D4R7_ANGCA
MEKTNFSAVSMVQCVLIGDRASRKRMMLKKYAKYSGASYDSEKGQVVAAFNGQKCLFMESMVNHFIENNHVFLICVSVACQANVEDTVKIILETVLDRCKNVPFVLVGTQIETRLIRTFDITGRHNSEGYEAMPMHRAVSLAKRIGAVKYLECSETTGEGLEEVFEEAFAIGYQYALEQQRNSSQRRKSSYKDICNRISTCIVQ